MQGKKKSSTVQIQQIADRLGVSLSTVSVVLNNRGDSMRISKETQKRVIDMAKEMNYQPNIYARRFRKSAEEKSPYIIAIFWRSEFLDDVLGKFIKGLYDTIELQNLNVELVIQPYDFHNLKKYNHFINSNHFSGAIVGGASNEDVDFLEQNDFDIPIILINRKSKKYNSVLVDAYAIGESCARLFHSRNHNLAGLISMANKGKSIQLIELAYKETCNKFGIRMNEEWQQDCESRNFSDGYKAVEKILSLKEIPTALFILDDMTAGGVFSACSNMGIQVPKDMEIISFGEKDYFNYLKPAISSIQQPFTKFAESAINMIITVIEDRVSIPMLQEHDPIFTFRESCGSFLNNVT